MDPLSAIASVITIYQLASEVSGLCFRYGQGVRQADRDADLLINEIDTFQKYLRKLKDILAKEDVTTAGTDRLRNLNDIISGESKVLKTCREDLEDIKIKLVKVQSKGHYKEAIHRLFWPLKQQEISKTLKALKKFTEAVDRALNVDNNEVLRAINSRAKHIQTSLEGAEFRNKQEKALLQLSQEQQRAEDIRAKILDWLVHPDPSEIHEVARRARNDRAKTGQWFLNGSSFREFQNTPRSVLWLHGDSGCGKSVLCSAIIDDLIACQSRDRRIQLAYWYFSVTDRKRGNLDILLRAVVAQFLYNRPIPPFLPELWNSRKMGREAPKMPELVQAIQEIVAAQPSQVYFIIIDALDESDEAERDELMRVVRDLTLLEVDIHILVSSRTNTIGVEKGMKDVASFYNITIERQDADLDILAHVTERLENDVNLAKWSPELRRTVKDTLIEQAEGMFRWVECQLQAVRRCRKPSEVRKALKTLPRDLHEVYARDLAKVDENASQDLIRLLEWLAFPQRRLRVEEVVDMLAVDMESDPPRFDEENRLVDFEEILQMCGSLVRLDTSSEGLNEIDDVTEVRTLTAAHTSVIDCLTTQPIKIGSGEALNLSRSKANLRMAETCLIHLLYFCENDIALSKENISSYPFAQLCAECWHIFYQEILQSAEQVDMTRLDGLVLKLFSSPSKMLNWVRLGDVDNLEMGVHFDVEISQIKPAIYYAALLRLPNIVKFLIQQGNPPNEVVGPRYGTPLAAACAWGRIDIASLLLDGGADPNLSGCFLIGTPLATAISLDQVEMVKFLLGRKDVNINGRRHPPLKATEEVLTRLCEFREHSAASKYDKQRLRLVEIGTELIELAKHADTGGWGSPYFKDFFGYEDIINPDLEEESYSGAKSIDPEVLGNIPSVISNNLDETHYHDFIIRATAASNRILTSTEGMVYSAVSYSTSETLELLLAAGADPNIQGGDVLTALMSACVQNKEAFVKTLLNHGARIDISGGSTQSSLNAACRLGHIRIVEILIEAGADVNRCDPIYLSSLYQGCCGDSADIVKILLQYGAAAEADLYPAERYSPLQLASAKGNIEVAQILLDAGSDVNRKAGTSATALYLACTNRDRKMVQLLLAHGADPNVQQCGTRDHALQESCENGDEEIVRLLLEQRARTDLRGGYYDNVLQAACFSTNEAIVRIILSHDADVNMFDWLHGSPLISACRTGQLGVARLLVEAGVDIHVTSKIGHSAILAACFGGTSRLELFDYLISLGADPLHEDQRGCNGLHYAARARKCNVIKRILEHEANINGNDLDGWSPLHWAIASTRTSTKMVKLLLESGIDRRIKDKQGRTALDLAISFQRTEQVAILENTAQAYFEPSEDKRSSVESEHDTSRVGSEDEESLVQSEEGSRSESVSGPFCDGCYMFRSESKPERWHHCLVCPDFDFCFRCILDKDIIHFQDHAFSSDLA